MSRYEIAKQLRGLYAANARAIARDDQAQIEATAAEIERLEDMLFDR